MSRSVKATAVVPIEDHHRGASLVVEFDRAEPELHRVVVTSGYHRAVNPDTGLNAVFIQGEAVPDWALTDDDRKALDLAQPKTGDETPGE